MDTGMEHILATFSFTNGVKTKMKFRIQLNPTDISILGEGEDVKRTKRILYSDITGVQLSVDVPRNIAQPLGAASSESLRNYITIYSYPSIKAFIGSKCTRRRLAATFGLSCMETPERNKEALVDLKEKIDSKIKEQYPDIGENPQFDKPVLVLVNPASGKGHAMKLFKEKISPMLQEAYVGYEVLETEKAGQGIEIAAQVDLSKYYGLVILSGDGLLYEVFQGLMSRADSEEAIKTPIGILPAGSGNALCCSLNYNAKEPFLHDMLIHSTFLLLKHTVRPMDMIAIDTIAGRVHSFLSVTWGMVADIDIESERFRNLGNARFTLEAISRIISPRTYRGKLSFLPVTPYISKGRSKTDVDILAEQPHNQEDRVRSASMPPPQTANYLSTSQDNSSTTDSSVAHFNGSDHISTSDNNIDIQSSFQMPDLLEPTPSDWVTCEDNFMTIIASYQTHLGPDLMAAPAATMHDGLIYLLLMRAPLTRMQMLTIMGQLETGAHTKNPLVEMVPVRAFRLEPCNKIGNMVVDGEKVPYGPIQAHVLSGKARVMAK